MYNLRKIIAVCLSVVLTVAIGMPVFADTTDSYDQHYWSADDRYDATPYRTKDTGSRVYFRIINNSLPVGGVDFHSQVSLSGGGYQYSPWYTVTRNSSYAINHTVGQLAAGRPVRLESYYPSSRYSWGNVEIMWSPDYVSDGSTLLG